MKLLAMVCVAAVLATGCATDGGMGYGGTSSRTGASGYSSVMGRVAGIEPVTVGGETKLGVGTAIGAVAGGLLGHQIGSGRGNTAATVIGAGAGAVAGSVAEGHMRRGAGERITVDLDRNGGRVVVTQPGNSGLRIGQRVRIEGTGDAARVYPY